MKKIMFNDKYGLTQAVLEGRKTMTRRLVPEKLIKAIEGGVPGFAVMESKYKVGEVVAVAQKYEDIYYGLSDREASWFLDMLHLRYDGKCALDLPAWRNKEFVMADLMPHQIRITNVRVERLQDISDEDCIREGIYKDNPRPGFYFNGYAFELSQDQDGDTLASRWFKTSREAFAALIDKVSGKGTWESNPWVFVYEFEPVK